MDDVEVMMSETESMANDLLKGAAAIGAFLNEPKRRVYYLIDTRQLPAFRLGGKVYARKSKLIERIEALEQEQGGGA